MLTVCAVLVASPLPGLAGQPAAPTETVVYLHVQPMAAPKPALKYRLLPDQQEMNPGNPIQAYLKCFMEQQNFFFNQKAVDDREKWQTMPLEDLPLQELRGYGGSALRQADFAARLDAPDWQILTQLKREGANLLLPEVQQLRMLAAALKVRFRAEVAGRRFDDAVRTAKTMLAMSRHLAEHPTLITNLVGLAVASLALGPLEEMLAQPGCPNLYWALTDLPSPLIDIRKGSLGDRYLAAHELALLDTKEPMTEAQLRKAVDKARDLVKISFDGRAPKQGMDAWLEDRLKNEGHVRAARQRLLEFGLDAEQVKTFPALQVVLLDEKFDLDVQRDEEVKALSLPFPQAQAMQAAFQQQRQAGDPLFRGLFVSCFQVRKSQTRVEQRLALLRGVEALRLYAAGHGGKFPAQLDDLTVPVPLDPVTGKPFLYKLEGGTAHLQATAPLGEEKRAAFNVRYEVTVRK
jgi:hypothetical protein